MNIFIISCGKAKVNKKTSAYKLYSGGFFKKQLSLVRSMGATKKNTFILSAKYGLIPCEEIIAPYDLKMGSKGCVDYNFVNNQALKLNIKNAKIISTAGSAYRIILKKIFSECKFPLEGIGGMGLQIKEMNRLIGKNRC